MTLTKQLVESLSHETLESSIFRRNVGNYGWTNGLMHAITVTMATCFQGKDYSKSSLIKNVLRSQSRLWEPCLTHSCALNPSVWILSLAQFDFFFSLSLLSFFFFFFLVLCTNFQSYCISTFLCYCKIFRNTNLWNLVKLICIQKRFDRRNAERNFPPWGEKKGNYQLLRQRGVSKIWVTNYSSCNFLCKFWWKYVIVEVRGGGGTGARIGVKTGVKKSWKYRQHVKKRSNRQHFKALLKDFPSYYNDCFAF